MRNRRKSPYRAAKTYVNNNGYRVFKDSGIPVHRWVAENKLGRPLRNGEVVHHKDRNKQNNSAQNLAVLSSQKAHFAIHKKDAKNYGWRYSFIGEKKQG